MITPLKVLFAGIPDAGKSTMIGRILQDTGSVFFDQKQEDLAHYTDGLSSEIIQGRTIDVSYRTVILKNKCRCILIDTPGHSELMSNFVSGVSNADVVFYLKDSTRPLEDSIHPKVAKDFGVPVVTIWTKNPDNGHFSVDSITGDGFPHLLCYLQEAAALQGEARRKFLEGMAEC